MGTGSGRVLPDVGRADFRVSCREFSGARGIGFRGSRVERNAEAGRY